MPDMTNITPKEKISGFCGLLTGATLYAELGLMGFTGAALGAGAFINMPIAILICYPVFKLAKQINEYFEDDSDDDSDFETESNLSRNIKLMSAQFLLFASASLLSNVLGLMIFSAITAISIANPLTMPLMIAAGASALIILGLYLLTRPTQPSLTSNPHLMFSDPKRMMSNIIEGIFQKQDREAHQITPPV